MNDSASSSPAPTPLTPHIQTFVLGGFFTNCFLITVPDHPDPDKARECWIVDCGFEPEPMFDHIEKNGLKPTAVLLTHGHTDHIAGIDAVRDRFGEIPVYMHEAEKGFCSDPTLNMSAMMGMNVSCGEPDRWLKGGEELDFNGTTWRVIHTPGHSPGGVLYVHDDSAQAIVGDTLFAGSIGRVDFPTSSVDQMRHSLHNVIMSLPDEITVNSGHGPPTTIGRERTTNPYVVERF